MSQTAMPHTDNTQAGNDLPGSPLEKMLHSARALGLLPANAQPPADPGRPWPVVLLTLLGAWLATLPVLAIFALFAGRWLLDGAGTYVVGALAMSGAVALLRVQGLALFLEQIAIPALFTGGWLLGFALVRDGPHLLAAATLLLITGTGVVGWLVARALGMEPKTLVPPMMFNNCGNLGLPLAVLAFGETALAPAVVMFLVSNLLHFSFGAWLLDHRTRLLTLWRSPVILATLAGLAVGLAGVTVWPPLLMSVKMVGDISIPLMLFALGARLADSKITAVGVGLLGAALRPIVGLGLAWAVLQVLDLPAREQALVLVFGALPPAVLNYMFAERYQQEPDKVASMVLIGNVAAVVFLPIALALALD